MNPRTTLALSLALIALFAPATAGASAADVVRDCTRDGDLDRRHASHDLARALGALPSDVRDYSGCREAIARQQRIYAPVKVGRTYAVVRVQCFSTRPARVSLLYRGRSVGTRAFRCRARRALRPSVRLSRFGERLASRPARRVRLVFAVGRRGDSYPLEFGRPRG
jgi:hypothetical protein